MTDATKTLLAQCRYIRDHDALAARQLPQAAAIVSQVAARIAARYERNQCAISRS